VTVDLLGAAHRLDQATTAAEFVHTATALLNEAGAHGAELYAVDHEVRHVVSLEHSGETFPIDDELLAALMGNWTVDSAGSTWSPLPNRQQPFLVARIASSQSMVDPGLGSLIGELYAHRSRSRFALEQPRRRAAMSIAAELQWEILPFQTDRSSTHAVAAALRPAYDVAGDAFDYELSETSTVAYALDAMGHGITATLSATLAVTALRNSRRSGASLAEQVTAAHHAILDEWDGDRFVTLVAVQATIDEVRIVNAGHEPLRRRHKDGAIQTLRLHADPPAGVPHNQQYRTTEIAPLMPGEGLVILSDGAASSQSISGAALGPEGVNRALASAWSPVPFTSVHRFLASVNHDHDAEQLDDITALIMVAQ